MYVCRYLLQNQHSPWKPPPNNPLTRTPKQSEGVYLARWTPGAEVQGRAVADQLFAFLPSNARTNGFQLRFSCQSNARTSGFQLRFFLGIWSGAFPMECSTDPIPTNVVKKIVPTPNVRNILKRISMLLKKFYLSSFWGLRFFDKKNVLICFDSFGKRFTWF